MTTDENTLWTKISSFKFDDEDSSFKFSHRLARENGWTISYSKNVLEEYKKFIFLCCISKTGVTPSDQVDQAWHLHLTYTKSYWVDLCRETLEKEIHHNPTKGGHSEGKKFDDFYTATIKLYKDKFKADPPKTIWPDNEKRFSDINFQRVNLKNYWLFHKPGFSKKSLLFLVLFISLFSIQATSKNDTGFIVSLLIVVGFFIYGIFKNKNGGGGSGCSTSSGCGGHHGHSGCGSDSGCGGGGCSGCGGD